MPQTSFRRYLITGSLAAVLLMAGAAPANARDLGTVGHAWSWLQDVWLQGVAALWNGQGHESHSRQVPGVVSIRAKEGPGLDPNGSIRTNSLTLGDGPSTSTPASPNG